MTVRGMTVKGRTGRRTTLVAAVALVLSSLVGGGAVRAADQSSDEAALAAARPAAADAGIEQKVNALVGRMTVAEKLQQLQLLSDGQVTDADARAGVGGVFSLVDPVRINQLQHIAVEQSRLHIPILFAYDTIHGYRTIFPAPLGAASAFDPSVARADATVGARETATVGIKQVYSPMVDVSHEPRWGRIAEGDGEDPYLGSVYRGGPGEGRPGHALRGPGQGRGQRQAPRRVRAAGGRPGLQHHRHVRAAAAQPLPAAVQGRDRRRRRHGDVLVQRDQRRPGLREPAHRDRHREEGVGLRRLHRERLHRRRGAAGVPAGATRPPARAGTAWPRTGRRPGRCPSTPAPTSRWSAPRSGTSDSSCCRTGDISMAGSTTRSAASCG